MIIKCKVTDIEKILSDIDVTISSYYFEDEYTIISMDLEEFLLMDKKEFIKYLKQRVKNRIEEDIEYNKRQKKWEDKIEELKSISFEVEIDD